MDRLIYQALNLKVATPLPRRAPLWRRPVWNLAASALLTVLIATAAWLVTARGSFAEQVIAHVNHEPYAMVRTTQSVETERLDRVLRKVGLRLKPNALHVSYARSCWFRGHFIPHMIVQTEHGPAAVMVLTQESVQDGLKHFTSQGFNGMVLPAPRGVVIVLGEDFPVEGIAAQVQAAFEVYEPAGRRLG